MNKKLRRFLSELSDTFGTVNTTVELGWNGDSPVKAMRIHELPGGSQFVTVETETGFRIYAETSNYLPEAMDILRDLAKMQYSVTWQGTGEHVTEPLGSFSTFEEAFTEAQRIAKRDGLTIVQLSRA